MKHKAINLTLGAALGFSLLALAGPAAAHCDTMNGPVILDAKKALDSGNVNPALIWVQAGDEAEIRRAFAAASAVRKAGGKAKELADHHFFETLVRVHRAGEGAPYTGLKPAATPEPAVAAADRSIAAGKLDAARKLVEEQVEHGLKQQFQAVMAKKDYKANDVAAGRAYAGAYVQYVHYVERLHETAASGAEHGHGHEAVPAKHADPHAH